MYLRKTETALLTAKGLKVDNFHRIMLSRFDDTPGNQVTDLINEIALQARKNRYSVILLDELDKIPRNFQNALLEMFDSDFIVLREGTDSKVAQRPTRVYTKDMTFFIGSNYLSEWLLEKLGKNKNLTETDITLEEMNKVMLERGASAPLMDRLGISRYVYFPPKPEELRQIYQLRLKEKLEAYKKNNRIKVRLENPQDFIEHVMKETESKKYSTRQGQDYLAMLVDKLVAERLSHLSRPPASLTVSAPTMQLSCDALFTKKNSGQGFGFLKGL
jgi:ATP-dependent Clp protease ATP-binding subunit ClpA